MMSHEIPTSVWRAAAAFCLLFASALTLDAVVIPRDKEVMLIGRDEACDIVLQTPQVSRRHAQLKRLAGGDFELRDLGSINGTYVNGQRIKTTRVSATDLVAFGSVRVRLDALAGVVRRDYHGDNALALSGLLAPKIGGPSVYPPAPEFLFVPPASFDPKNWDEAKGEDRYRRAIYTFRYRSVPYPMLQTFDAPNGDFSCVRRVRSNTPLQALTTLNEPLFVESARALALRTLREGGETDAQRLTYAFRRCLARKPTQPEAAELLSVLNKQTQRLADGWLSPWDLAGYDSTQRPQLPKSATPVQLAAWTTVCRVLLNLDETITKE